ncbi:SusC/RagA family TonB-linked outer membrane protein [Flammeovirga kamogawensis]|uniref:SusC/RagA family TonB-linked outer membrane protein n=1 Tax=Flammeovirga kamogawensis TaxID=373891 RepID=A0ABX8GQH5_9BACT|nr:SusC/RagA family TonB-linked outer membrane protein [Flammeovirga kamogawensis]MBB6462041.1 TonB-linked SusC/RagA family outer membrane protein [Flammeovirga kamogawensis]QWG05776.1 SusC/RagA family TonB-linked outer membrane protein [Flammeovirga kamogawensis]TRX67603.1 SusC/RagA family TonB-linked outer membrane protein [Flammeovirga kamogawensis]
MRLRATLCWLLSVISISISLAQEKVISGTVTDGVKPLPGVTVVVKGTRRGAVSDIDGKYKIQLQSEDNTIVFNFIGMQSKEVTVGNQSVIDVAMEENTEELDEVIVTANAIEREKRTLGYSVTSVKGEEVDRVKSTNFLNSLSGKVPGVQVSQASSNPGGSTRIVIRGTNSLSGGNQPLIVVDGIPVSNTNISTGSGISGAFDAGNGAGEINPADIASVTVLKGASAAALYGSRAANGAIIITTKKGNVKEGPTVSLSSSFRAESPNRLPSFQNRYAQGYYGKYDKRAENGWGPEINGQVVPAYSYAADTADLPESQWPLQTLKAYPTNVEDFYQTGTLFINSVDVSSATEKGDYRLGFTSMNQKGIVPGAGLDRYTFAVNAGQQLNKVIKSRVGMNYIKSETRGSVSQGGNSPNVLTSIINGIPRTTPLERLYLVDGEQDPIGRFSNSPYWVAEKNGNNVNVNRFFGFGMLEAKATDWLTFRARAGLDYRVDKRFSKSAKGTLGAINGSFVNDDMERTELTTSLMATIQKEFGDKFKLTAIVGHEYNSRVFKRSTLSASELSVTDLYTPANAKNTTSTTDFVEQRLLGAYGDISLTYNNYLTLNVTMRNDWSSTLPKDNRSYFYPSGSLSFVFSEALNLHNDVFSYGKLRLSAAQVGNDTNPYQLDYYYYPRSTYFGQYSTSNNYPFNGQTAYTATDVIPPEGLVPERQNSWEVGTELSFFNGRIGIDLTYYQIETKNQILAVPTPESTGYRSKRVNAGAVQNEGIELLLSFVPIQSDAFEWNSQINFTKNRNKVTELTEGLEKLQIASGFNGVSVQAVPGKSLELQGVGFKRADSGEILVDPKTGLRMQGDEQTFGEIQPDFLLGFQNSFTYKGVTLNFLIDWNQGGKMISRTVGDLRYDGFAEETALNREQAFVDKNAYVENGDGTLRQNDIAVTHQDYWQSYSTSGIAEGAVFNKTYVKLREISLAYTLPPSIIKKTNFLKSVSIGFEARNLWLIYSEIPHIDPETSLFQAASDASGAVEMGSLPSTRSFGGNLKIIF